ncbi:5'-nucleotidase C-terminal domain-containing protein [Rurimicrobium arvi]|uniref:5'-Nucleotidase C-terminal domain-containing protein n=1 Tax=Rurimicrobium arvi TaxID=2049916 RepID=A0ABP8MS61_9BACT
MHLSDTLCTLQQPFSKAQPESGMTNWMADAVARNAQAFCSFDACVLSYELLSCAYLSPGPVCRRDMYRLIEQDDALGLLELDGRQLQLLCDSIASAGGIPLSGIQFSIKAHKAVNVHIKDKVLHPDLVYRILLNKGLLQSRSMPACVYHNKHWRFCCPSVRYLLISDLENTLQQQTLLKNSTDQRISYDD